MLHIHVYVPPERPVGESQIVENKKVYQYMENNNQSEFSFGILMDINDYDWHNGEGNGSLDRVFNDFEEAKKHRKVHPCSLKYIQDARTDLPIKITIEKQDEKNRIKICVDERDEPLFDILHPQKINNIIPVPE